MNRFLLLILAISCCGLGGCVNLKLVSTFCTTSAGSVQHGTRLPTTFTDVYRQRTLEDSLDRHPFNRIPLIGIDFPERIRKDSLRSYQVADSLVQNANTLLTTYFQALAALSATGDSFVPVQLKSTSLNDFLQSPAGNFSAEETAAFNRVANLLGSMATGAYRRHKLATLLEQSHSDVTKLMGVLIFAHERLAQVVDLTRDQQYGHYKNILIRDPSLTYLQKRELARQWLQTLKSIEQTRQAVLTHVKTLKTVQTGYNEMFVHRNKLTGKAILTSLGTYVSTLKQLQTDLDQLTPVYGRLKP